MVIYGGVRSGYIWWGEEWLVRVVGVDEWWLVARGSLVVKIRNPNLSTLLRTGIEIRKSSLVVLLCEVASLRSMSTTENG